MLAELTLTMEKPIIEQAQQYAYEKNTDLSQVVSDYLQSLMQNSEPLAQAETIKLEDTKPKKRQLGFMKGQIKVPEDINWGDDKILAEFGETP